MSGITAGTAANLQHKRALMESVVAVAVLVRYETELQVAMMVVSSDYVTNKVVPLVKRWKLTATRDTARRIEGGEDLGIVSQIEGAHP